MNLNNKKFCSVLRELSNEIADIRSFYCHVIDATEWELANDYEDAYYDTNVTVREDLTATVYQVKKAELVDLVVMDHPPNPNFEFDPFNSINEIPEEKSWDLSEDEVSVCLSKIILPSFENYLKKMKDGIATIQKLEITDSTIKEAVGLLQVLYNRGESVRTQFVRPTDFVKKFKNYISLYLDLNTIGRFEEFPVRLGFDSILVPGTPPAEIKEPVSVRARRIFDKLKSLNPREAMTTNQLLDWLSRDHNDTVDDGTLRRALKELSSHGVYNKKRIGYCIKQ
jgi:hypothetical protein